MLQGLVCQCKHQEIHYGGQYTDYQVGDGLIIKKLPPKSGKKKLLLSPTSSFISSVFSFSLFSFISLFIPSELLFKLLLTYAHALKPVSSAPCSPSPAAPFLLTHIVGMVGQPPDMIRKATARL